jgi:hypothetical protein
MEESAPPEHSRSVWNTLKTFSPATFAGLTLVVLFLALCRIDTCVVRWWLMLPLAAAAGGTLLWRRTRAPEVESRICTAGLWILIALFFLRDIGLSCKLAELLDKVAKASRDFNHFFGR